MRICSALDAEVTCLRYPLCDTYVPLMWLMHFCRWTPSIWVLYICFAFIFFAPFLQQRRRVNYQRMNFLYPNASPPCHWTTDPLPSLPSPPLRLFVTGYLIQGSGSIHMLILPEQQLFTLLITPVVGDADLLTSHRDISMVRRGGGRNGAVWCVRAPRVEEGKKEAGLCASSQR